MAITSNLTRTQSSHVRMVFNGSFLTRRKDGNVIVNFRNSLNTKVTFEYFLRAYFSPKLESEQKVGK